MLKMEKHTTAPALPEFFCALQRAEAKEME